MKRIDFHPKAEIEFARDVEFYRERGARLSTEFVAAVKSALSFVQLNPDAGTPRGKEVRGWLVRRFPYTVIYREEDNRLFVLAIAAHRRHPGYWLERV
ncbi:MAG TPA: type II toxin-antitoxin system RelE/ParE family toxin [Longimicrobium sp.]